MAPSDIVVARLKIHTWLANGMAIDITVNIREAKTRLQEQRGKAQQGDRVILTNTGNPVAERTPVVLKAPRKPEVLKGKVMFSDSFFQPTDGEGNSSLVFMHHLLDTHFLIYPKSVDGLHLLITVIRKNIYSSI